MKPADLKFPTDFAGRAVGILLLALLPLLTFVPFISIPVVWWTQDLWVRWTALGLFLLCFALYWVRPRNLSLVKLDLPDILILLFFGWTLLSVKNSKEAFVSFYAFRNLLALTLLWFSLRSLWPRWPGLWAFFEKVLFWTATVSSLWLLVSTAGHFLTTLGRAPGIDFFVNLIPRKGFFSQ